MTHANDDPTQGVRVGDGLEDPTLGARVGDGSEQPTMDAPIGNGPEEPTLGPRTSEVPSMKEGPTLIHIWELDPAQEDAAVTSLQGMFSEVARDPGFVSARILGSPDRISLAAIVEMRTVEDRQRLEQLPEVRNTLHRLRVELNLIMRMYHQLAVYGM